MVRHMVNDTGKTHGDKSLYVRVKLNRNMENKSRGFYLLMTNGNIYSDKKYEFIIERRLVGLLQKKRVQFEIMPVNPK